PKSDPERFIRLYQLANENGFAIYPNNMFGLLGETKQTLQEQDRFFALYGGVKRFHRSITVPRPGTRLYEIALHDGLITHEDSWGRIAEIAGQVGNKLNKKDLIENISLMDELEQVYKRRHGMDMRKKAKN
ncbi:MAG: hypothetical protein ACFFCW_39430, partial [Candidatus Hodarchaeota archaeon]